VTARIRVNNGDFPSTSVVTGTGPACQCPTWYPRPQPGRDRTGRAGVEGLTADEHGTAARLDEQYADLDLGLADLSVVVLAHRFRTRRLLTFDERDFRAVKPLAGGSFTLLPRDETD